MAFTGNDDNDRLRPGPELLPADRWGEPPPETTSQAYAGRHHTRASSSRARLAIGAGIVGLIVLVVALPFIVDGSADPDPTRSTASVDSEGFVPGDVVSTAAASAGGVSASPSGRAASTTAPPVATAKPTSRTPVPTFRPLTFEAEAGGPSVTVSGSAWIDGYDGASNGKIVRNLGDWDMRGGPGSLRLNGVRFPTTATYVIAIFFVHPDNESTRTAQLAVSGMDPVKLTFNGSSRCCGIKKVSLTISAGTHTITISNPTGHAPSIDKIVISRE